MLIVRPCGAYLPFACDGVSAGDLSARDRGPLLVASVLGLERAKVAHVGVALCRLQYGRVRGDFCLASARRRADSESGGSGCIGPVRVFLYQSATNAQLALPGPVRFDGWIGDAAVRYRQKRPGNMVACAGVSNLSGHLHGRYLIYRINGAGVRRVGALA